MSKAAALCLALTLSNGPAMAQGEATALGSREAGADNWIFSVSAPLATPWEGSPPRSPARSNDASRRA